MPLSSMPTLPATYFGPVNHWPNGTPSAGQTLTVLVRGNPCGIGQRQSITVTSSGGSKQLGKEVAYLNIQSTDTFFDQGSIGVKFVTSSQMSKGLRRQQGVDVSYIVQTRIDIGSLLVVLV